VSTGAPSTEETPIDRFHTVESIDEIADIWVPVEVGGEPVNALALGAYLQVWRTTSGSW
jgi:hypothetical protein